MFALPNDSSACFPDMPIGVRSTKTIWLSVPPDTSRNPPSFNFRPSLCALLITFSWYVTNSLVEASSNATALAAMVCSIGPPCMFGNTALFNFLDNSLFAMINPPRGPLKVL